MKTVMTCLCHQHVFNHLLMLGLSGGTVILDPHVNIIAEIFTFLAQ